MRWWLILLIVASALGISTLIAYSFNKPVNGNSSILAVAYLPTTFTVTGPYAKAFYNALNMSLNSIVSINELSGKPNVKLTWHIDELTLILLNGSKISIEAKTQVIQVRISNKWITVMPNTIKPGYEIRIVKGGGLLNALNELVSKMPPPMFREPYVVVTSVPIVHKKIVSSKPYPVCSQYGCIQEFNVTEIITINESYLYKVGYTGGDPTWALAAFTNVNKSSVICGYTYPDNGSNLVIPSSDYAAIPLTVDQYAKQLRNVTNENSLGTVVYSYGILAFGIQPAFAIWRPALLFNIWVPGYEPYIGWMPLSTVNGVVDWLATGVTLCTSIKPNGDGYETLLSASVNNVNYTEAYFYVTNSSTSVVNGVTVSTLTLSVQLGSSMEWESNPGTVTVSNVTYLSPTIGSWPCNANYTCYPSMAFETSDTSSSFFSNNTGFALVFSMGDNPTDAANGEWPLYYSISNDTLTCSGIWGTAAVGSIWPPSSGLWGASGLTVEYPGEPVSYEAIIGSLSQIKNSVGISCQYVDTELSALNTESSS